MKLLKNKKIIKYSFILFLLLLLLIFCLCACQKGSYEKLSLEKPVNNSELVVSDTLTIATSPGFPPYTYDNNGTLTGFDIEFSKVIADSLGLKLNIIPFAYNETLYNDTMQGQKFDAAISDIAKNSFTKSILNHSKAYDTQDEKMQFVTKKDSNITDANIDQEINNKTKIAVVEASSFRYHILDYYPNANVVSVATIDDLVNTLNKGEATIALADGAFFDKSENKDAFKLVKDIDITEEICVVISKNKPCLLDSINEVIDKRTEDGTIDNLRKKYNL